MARGKHLFQWNTNIMTQSQNREGHRVWKKLKTLVKFQVKWKNEIVQQDKNVSVQCCSNTSEFLLCTVGVSPAVDYFAAMNVIYKDNSKTKVCTHFFRVSSAWSCWIDFDYYIM